MSKLLRRIMHLKKSENGSTAYILLKTDAAAILSCRVRYHPVTNNPRNTITPTV
jgi:hypothetical protein